MQTRGRFTRSIESGDGGFLSHRVHLDATHHVVGGRSDFHALLGNVNGSQFLELMIHSRQFLLHLFFGSPRDVEIGTTMFARPPRFSL